MAENYTSGVSKNLEEILSKLEDLLEKRVTRTQKETPKPSPKNLPKKNKNKSDMASTEQLKELLKAALEPVGKSIDALKASNDALTASHLDLKKSIDAQNTIIDEMRTSISKNSSNIEVNTKELKEHKQSTQHMQFQIYTLENQVDDLQQERLSSGAILSGTLITEFITTSALGNVSYYAGHSVIEKLEKAINPAVPVQAADTELENRPESVPVAINQIPVTSKPIKFQYIRKIKAQCLMVGVHTRDSVHALFKRSKETASGSTRAFYVAEQLTRTRQQIMRGARSFPGDLENLNWRTYTRNGVPMARLGDEDPTQLKTSIQFENFMRSVERRLNSPRNDLPRCNPNGDAVHIRRTPPTQERSPSGRNGSHAGQLTV